MGGDILISIPFSHLIIICSAKDAPGPTVRLGGPFHPPLGVVPDPSVPRSATILREMAASAAGKLRHSARMIFLGPPGTDPLPLEDASADFVYQAREKEHCLHD